VAYLHHYADEPESERMAVLQDMAKKGNALLGDRFCVVLKCADISRRAKRLSANWEKVASAVRRRYLERLAETHAALVLTGHQRSDYFETLKMRQERRIPKASWPKPEFCDAVTGFVRPLMVYSRDEIRHLAEQRGLRWFEDPQNTDPRCARVRLRLAHGFVDYADAYGLAAELPQPKAIHRRELVLEESLWQSLSTQAQRQVVFNAWKKLGIFGRFTRSDFSRAHQLPFAKRPFFVHREFSEGRWWIIFRRGLGRAKITAKPPHAIRGDAITRSLKIAMPYGHKSVKKILSEKKLSPRQRRLTWIVLDDFGCQAVRIVFPPEWGKQPIPQDNSPDDPSKVRELLLDRTQGC
ncbi:MAG: hypothetical protein N2Z22_09410, partial [Turneriella sp.]|nr:hypothetical protein [Turneriella sp.]